ncbi:MAG: ATP/GTP-binding protein [Thermoanaerobaculia bacterium]
MIKRSLVLTAVIVLAGCARETTQTTATTDTQATTTTSAANTSSATAAPRELKDGLQTPESVLYDAAQDVIYISNINGQPLAVDNNGYISRLNAETLHGDMKFIEAGKNNVTLNAPKGLAIVGNDLFVADITSVRKFDKTTGAPKGEIKIPGSTFLNDLATDGKVVYVSDSGLKAGEGGNFAPTGTDAIWKISGDKATKIASGSDLNRPNGLEIADGKLWAVTFGASELYQVENGRKANVVKLPKGSLDGLVHMTDGTFLVSSWESNSIFRGPAGGPFTEVITGVNSPADIGYDTKRHRLLVPHFMESRVTIHDLQ